MYSLSVRCNNRFITNLLSCCSSDFINSDFWIILLEYMCKLHVLLDAQKAKLIQFSCF